MKSSLSHFFQFFPKQRRGMEIAINTLVVMILGILIVGGGIILIAKISGGGIDVAKSISKDQEQRIAAMLEDGQLAAIYPSSQRISGGKASTYALGVFNTLPQETEFTITHSGEGIEGLNINHLPTLDVKSNDRATAPIVVKPASDMPPGTYTVIIDITYKNDEGVDEKYDTRFFTVKVQ